MTKDCDEELSGRKYKTTFLDVLFAIMAILFLACSLLYAIMGSW